jgi:hypothetical protein
VSTIQLNWVQKYSQTNEKKKHTTKATKLALLTDSDDGQHVIVRAHPGEPNIYQNIRDMAKLQ